MVAAGCKPKFPVQRFTENEFKRRSLTHMYQTGWRTNYGVLKILSSLVFPSPTPHRASFFQRKFSVPSELLLTALKTNDTW